jgi:AcrR family transcriptional regulator
MVEEDKKKRILEAALKLFVEKGIDNTSTALISKEADVATGTIYLYFENKVDLISKLYISIKEESMVNFLDLIEYSVSYDSLERFWIETVEWGVNNPDKFRFMMQFNSSPYHTDDTQVKYRDFEKNAVKLIEDGIQNKLLKDLPPKYIWELFSAHFTFTVEYIIQTKTKERKIFFDTLLDGIKYNL